MDPTRPHATSRDAVPSFVTKDGSLIRELMHPRAHAGRAQSLAEATVPQGVSTTLHRHARTEEIYHFTQGRGTMTLGDQTFRVAAGDTVVIEPGLAHRVRNDGADALVLLCACTPPYSDEDTELLE